MQRAHNGVAPKLFHSQRHVHDYNVIQVFVYQTIKLPLQCDFLGTTPAHQTIAQSNMSHWLGPSVNKNIFCPYFHKHDNIDMIECDVEGAFFFLLAKLVWLPWKVPWKRSPV